jgi:hypothetical protein
MSTSLSRKTARLKIFLSDPWPAEDPLMETIAHGAAARYIFRLFRT